MLASNQQTEEILMKIMKPYVAFFLLGLLSLTGCGEVEPNQLFDDPEQSAEDMAVQQTTVCEPPLDTARCYMNTIYEYPSTCSYSRYYSHYCPPKGTYGCLFWDCWRKSWGGTDESCSDFVARTC